MMSRKVFPPAPNVLNFSGNCISFPGFSTNVYPSTSGAPTAGVNPENCTTLNMCGNVLASGGYGLFFTDGCTNALLLNNDFSGATFGGIGGLGANNVASLPAAQIINNKLAAGVTFHVQLPPQVGVASNWFLYGNQFLDASSNVVPPFLDPASSAARVTP